MQIVNITDLKHNLSAWLKRVRNGEELIVEDHNRLVARVLPLSLGNDFDDDEESLIADGLMRLPIGEKSDAFLNYPAPKVSLNSIRISLRAERDED